MKYYDDDPKYKREVLFTALAVAALIVFALLYRLLLHWLLEID